MVGTTPEFDPFAEHPHLGIWLVALVFKVLPPADWSGRIAGHLFYIGFLFSFFYFVRKKSAEQVAVTAVLLLWIWARFSNFFSNIYLDPFCLFFGFGSLVLLDEAFTRKEFSSLLGGLAGMSVALSAMSKGLTVLGFGPAIAWVAIAAFRGSEVRKWLKILALYFAACAIVLGAYYLAVRRSTVPDFFQIYFSRQWSSRFSQDWDWARLVIPSYWKALYHDTGAILLASFVGLFYPKVRRTLVLPLLLFSTFVLMYAPTNRYGSNYWITVLPWVAWLAAAGICAVWGKWNTAGVVKWTSRFALFAVILIQYIPVRTHGARPPQELETIALLKKAGRAEKILVDLAPHSVDFTVTDNFFWYGDLPTGYLEKDQAIPRPKAGEVLVLYNGGEARAQEARRAGWFFFHTIEGRPIWLHTSP